MFESFFPKPKQFFTSFAVWALVCVVGWYLVFRGLGGSLGIGSLIGFPFPESLSDPTTDEARAAYEAAKKTPQTIWTYQYMIVCYALFCGFWTKYASNKWTRWSVWGSALIIFVVWFQVQVDVMINEWFGGFYDTIQIALGDATAVTQGELYGHLGTFLTIAMVAVTVAVLNAFFVSHYIFRWRTAMNDRYMSMWSKIRHIEGASQRVQEDTMRFAAIMESLGVQFVRSIMTLIAFLPILWGLSSYVKVLPIVGEVPQALVFVAIIWSVFGTTLLALAGYKLPGLEFRNQRVEAAYRKELVIGEDDPSRAQPDTVRQLFDDVRKNYFRLYLHYLYFNIVRYSYLQLGGLLPYVALGPTIVTAGFTLGIMQQILRAFGKVEDSFQFLVHSWTTIVELMSIYKRLAAFEASIAGQELSGIEKEVQA